MMLRISKKGEIVSERDRTLNGSYTERLISNVDDFSGPELSSVENLLLKERRQNDLEKANLIKLNEIKKKKEDQVKLRKSLNQAHNNRILKSQSKAKTLDLLNSNVAAITALKTKKELENPNTMGNANWGQYEIINGNILEPDINDPHRDYSKIEQGYFIGQPIGQSVGDSEIVGFFPESYGSKRPQMGDFWSNLRDTVTGKAENVLQTKLPEIVEKGLTSVIDPQSGQKYNVDPLTGRVLGPASSILPSQPMISPQTQKMMIMGIVGLGGLTVLIMILKMFKKPQQIIVQKT